MAINTGSHSSQTSAHIFGDGNVDDLAQGQYAQFGLQGDASLARSSIGEVTFLTGEANVRRESGNQEPLHVGSPIYQNDIIRTGPDSVLNLVFEDETAFSLARGAEMVVDEFSYSSGEPENNSTDSSMGSFIVNIVQGAFTFVSGHIADLNSDGFVIKTSAGVLAVRGTAGGGFVSQTGTSEFFNVDGVISITTEAGVAVLDTPYEVTQISNSSSPPAKPFQSSAEKLASDYALILSVSPPSIFETLRELAEPNNETTDETSSETSSESGAQNTNLPQEEPNSFLSTFGWTGLGIVGAGAIVYAAVSNTDNYDGSLEIFGNGSKDSNGNRTITFRFGEKVLGFEESDIIVINGRLNSGSLTKISSKVWTATVTPDASGAETNVAVRVGANAAESASGRGNNFAANETTLVGALKSHNAHFDYSIWDTSHVVSMSGTFSGNSGFSQAINGWNTSNVTDMNGMFYGAISFNQELNSWDTSKVSNMSDMFRNAVAFNRNLGDWNVSNVTNMSDMFGNSGMSVGNMDSTLRGWAKVDTSRGETALQQAVSVGLSGREYSDVTAVQYLANTYGWSIDGTRAGYDGSGRSLLVGSEGDNALATGGPPTSQAIHGLGGNDTIMGSSGSDVIVGGSGNDTLTGGNGADIFDYGFANAGNDTITDFTTGPGGDQIDIRDLLQGYDAARLTEFISAVSGPSGSIITIDHDGSGAQYSPVTISLNGVTYTDSLLQYMISNNNILV